MPMLVSICMPTHNGEEFLAAAIDSVLRQSYADFELLICDDCSTDRTLEIANRYASGDKRVVVWQNESRLGLFANYNECMTQAKGGLIKLFAQDDLLEPDALKQMVQALIENKVALVCCGKNYLDSSSMCVDEIVETSLNTGLTAGSTVIEQCLSSYRNLIGEPVAILFDARYVGKGFSENYYSLGDLEFSFRILQKGDLYYLPQKLVTFRRHPLNATSKMLEDMTWVLDFFKIGKEYSQYLTNIGLTEEEFIVGFIDRAGELMDKLVTESDLRVKNLHGFKEVAFWSMLRAAQLAAKAREYDAIVNSTSWKITEPLRYFKTKMESNQSNK